MNSKLKPFMQLEYMIAFFIISFIATIPSGAFAEPVKKTWDNSAVVQVKDTLRKISETAAIWNKVDGCNNRDCMNVNKLAEAGKIANVPKVPSGIGDDASNGATMYHSTATRMGGCGPKNSGMPVTLNPALINVSDGFCKDYNNSVGLGSKIIENCSPVGNCSASGSTNDNDFPTVNSQSFCFRRSAAYAIIWMGTINESTCP
jgi:hypothetical protein